MEKKGVDRKNTSGRDVRIIPTETKRETKGNVLYIREWEADKSARFFSAIISSEKLKSIFAKARVKLEKVTLGEEGDFVVYGYAGKPSVKLNRRDGQFYSLTSEIETFGKELVQQQAHIVLNLLKTNGLSNALEGKPVYVSSARQVLGKLRTYQSHS
jgi:hypothetical protein